MNGRADSYSSTVRAKSCWSWLMSANICCEPELLNNLLQSLDGFRVVRYVRDLFDHSHIKTVIKIYIN